MTTPKSKSGTIADDPIFQDERRRKFEEVYQRLMVGQPLDEFQTALLVNLLEEIREGYDPRPTAGIKPKAGVRSTVGSFQKYMALYYLKLRADKDVLEKNAVREVADLSGLSISSIRRLASEYEASLASFLQTTDLKTIKSVCVNLAENKRLTANPL